MENPGKNSIAGRNRGTAPNQNQLTPEHWLRLIVHRKWLILTIFCLVSVGTVIFTSRLPNVYASETLIMVDPQKVPESYVKATISGDIRNRLGTLKQQILSATRLEKIIDNLNLYAVERKTTAREDVITRMRNDISVSVVSDFGTTGGQQDLQAFRIAYRGGNPQLVAQVANELASLFIEENLKAREQQSEGTTEFLTNQLEGTRKTLEEQENKLRDFRMKHIGEMPEQQDADLQILGHLESQLQLEGDALNRAEQQRSYVESMMASQTGGVVNLEDDQLAKPAGAEGQATKAPAAPTPSARERELAALLARGYTENHPDVRRLKQEIERQAKSSKEPAPAQICRWLPRVLPRSTTPQVAQAPVSAPAKRQPPKFVNPVLQTQLTAAETEIARHKEQVDSLTKQISGYQGKLEAIPVREQEITELVRDYEISKAHYGQLLNSQLSAETATQLEVRQKGEKFSILDPAQPAQKPTEPNRMLLNIGGSAGGLVLALFVGLATQFFGMSITSADHMAAVTGLPVLEVIPTIETAIDQLARRRRMYVAAASGAAAVTLAMCAFLVYRFGPRFF